MAAAVVLVNCAAAFAALPAGQIETYPVPNAGSGEPTGITAGSDGSLWFTMHGGTGQLDRITTSGSFTEFPTATSDPGPITAGPGADTNLWFGDEGNDHIGKSTTTGSITEFTVPPVTDQAPEPTAITAGPGSALWFIDADGGSDTIDEIPTTATVATPGIQQFTVPTAGAYATGIASGPDGNLWFTEQGADQIGKLTPAGTFSAYSLPDLDSYPAAITAGPNGALWFTESDQIGEIPTTATVATPGIQQFPLTDGADPTDSIAVGPDGNLWFPVGTGSFSESIARMTPTGTVTYYPLSAPADTDPDVSSITAGPDGNMWFTEEGVDTIGEIGTSASDTAAGISLSPSGGLAFGNSTLGVPSGPQTVTVTNTGDAPLMLGTVQIQAATSVPFATTADGCSGETIAPGDTCTVGVTFTPATAGSYTANLLVSGNADNSPQSLPLSGSSEPVLTASGANFGNVALGTSSDPSLVTIDNTGGAPLQISSVQATGSQSPSFHLTSDGCSGQNVPAGGSCTVAVTFSPSAAGEISASLSVTDNAAGSPQALALNGAGVAPTVDVTPSGIDFGSVAVGQTSAPQTLTVSNTGAGPLAITRFQIVGSDGAAFQTSADTCTGQNVPAGGSCTVAVTFSPTGDGEFSASLQIADDGAGAPQSTQLGGVGVGKGAVLAPGDTGISGVVTNGTAAGSPPVSDVDVTFCLVRDGCLQSVWVTTAANGSYQAMLPAAGLWHVQVYPQGTLAGASADLTVGSGDIVVQNFTLTAPVPLSGGVTFTGAGGSITSGEPEEYVGLPFSFSSPMQVRGNQTPNSNRVYAFMGAISSGGSSGISLAGVIMFSVHFGATGQPEKMSDILVGQLDCGPLGSASPCANLIGLGSDVQPALVRARPALRAPREAGPIARAAQDCAPGTGAYKGQFNLYPTKNGGVLIEIYYGFDFYGEIPLDTLGFAPPAPTGNMLKDAGLNLSTSALNALVSKSPVPGYYNTAIGVLNNIATVVHSTDGGLTVGNVLNGLASIALSPLGPDMHGQFQWGADFLNNTLGGVLGTINPPANPTPCPPPPTPGPGGGGGGGGGGSGGSGGAGGGGSGDLYIDPSGLVQTTHKVPLAGATVTLNRAATEGARQVRVPAGSAVMSAGNRSNPDLTGPLGTFGWDVLPGYYTITASRSRCRSPTGGRIDRSAVHHVPPAVDDLVLSLRCPSLRRRMTRLRLSVLKEKYTAFVLTARLTARGAPRPFLGVVTIKLGRRTLASMAPEPRTGIVVVDGDGLRRGPNTLRATYSGDAALDPAAARLQVAGR